MPAHCPSFKPAYQLQPKLFVPPLFLGIENLQLNNRLDAVRYLSMARQLHLLGQIYASQGDTERAIEEYKLGLPSDDDGSVHFQLGRLYQRTGETKLAAEAFADSKTLNQRKQTAVRATFGLQQKTQPPQN
jgi:tetratricopeptide (TPR) repeat protein